MKRKYTKPSKDGCAGVIYDSPITGRDYGCDYDPPFTCEECMYGEGNNGKGKNPQAKRWEKRP
jgi:hypothetical protein